MNIDVEDTTVATIVATTATRKMAGSKAEPEPVPLLNVEDMKMVTSERRWATIEVALVSPRQPNKVTCSVRNGPVRFGVRLSACQVRGSPGLGLS